MSLKVKKSTTKKKCLKKTATVKGKTTTTKRVNKSKNFKTAAEATVKDYKKVIQELKKY